MQLIEQYKDRLRVYECVPNKEKLKQYRKENLSRNVALQRIYRLELENLELLKKLKEGQKIQVSDLFPLQESDTLITFQKIKIPFYYEKEVISRLIEAYINENHSQNIIYVYRQLEEVKPDSCYVPLKPFESIYDTHSQKKIYYYPYLLDLPKELQELEYLEKSRLSQIGKQPNENLVKIYKPVKLQKEIDMNLLQEETKNEIFIELPYHEELLRKLKKEKAC